MILLDNRTVPLSYIGRFISVDPIRDGTNWYVYCSNNPIAFVDPSGLADSAAVVLNRGFKFMQELSNADGPMIYGDTIAIAVGVGTIAIAGVAWVCDIFIPDEETSSIPNEDTNTTTNTGVTTDTTTDATTDTEEKDDPPRYTYIYRGGSNTYYNLTPSKNKDENGMSYYLTPPRPGVYSRTTLEAVNASGFLTAVVDGPNHVSVQAINKAEHLLWIETKSTAETNPHPYSVFLASISERFKLTREM